LAGDVPMSQIEIFGAGLSGLIAAKMLHEYYPAVHERQSSLPNNHNAVLRFRSSVVGDVTNIAFKKVKVIKAIYGSINPVADAIRYSLKVTGKLQSRSILDTDTVERYVAPEDLVSRLASTASIVYDVEFLDWSHNLIRDKRPPIISTIPMPAMMKMFEWREVPEFSYYDGWSVKLKLGPALESTIHATMYYPGSTPVYRATVCGGEVILEGVGHGNFDRWDLGFLEVLASLGLGQHHITDWGVIKPNRYQKIAELTPRDRDIAKRFIVWLTQKHGIYSLGRYATWRPKLLLDDLPQDVRIIKALIDGGDGYSMNLKMQTQT